MFHIKTKLPSGKVVKTEITDENVYTHCPDCGREFPVDLFEVFSGEGDVFSTRIVCPECTKKHFAKQMPAMEDIVLLTTALCRLGYGKKVLRLYDEFGIGAIQELEARDYGAYADALLSTVMKGGAA